MNHRNRYFAVRNFLIIAAAAFVGACGGGNPQTPAQGAKPTTPASAPVTSSDPAAVPLPGSVPVPPNVPIPPNAPASSPVVTPSPTTLSISAAALALSVNNTALNVALTGTPRTITITNTGSSAAFGMAYSTSAAPPAGTVVSSTCAATLAAATSCTITVTPGPTPTAAPGDLNPVPVVLSILGINTNTVTTSVSVLTYGSVYQNGYVFAVDDTTAVSGSIGGKVAALLDSATVVPYAPNTIVTNAFSLTNGVSNTALVIAIEGTPLAAYAAGLCTAPSGGFSDWYLPAPCEMGLDASCAVTMQNMQSSLVDNPVTGGPQNLYWTSAEAVGSGGNLSTQEFLSLGGGSFQLSAPKAFTEPLRCARIMTP
jgi:hypothetical protein